MAYQLTRDTKGFNWPEKVKQMAIKSGGGHNNISSGLNIAHNIESDQSDDDDSEPC